MIEEFKTFAMKGNVVDLAVAVVIGAAFGKIVSALVDNLITPLVGIVMGGVNFAELAWVSGEAVFGYGAFIQATIDFIIVALVLFVIIKAMNKAKGPEEEAAPAGPTEVELLTEIRDSLKK